MPVNLNGILNILQEDKVRLRETSLIAIEVKYTRTPKYGTLHSSFKPCTLD